MIFYEFRFDLNGDCEALLGMYPALVFHTTSETNPDRRAFVYEQDDDGSSFRGYLVIEQHEDGRLIGLLEDNERDALIRCEKFVGTYIAVKFA